MANKITCVKLLESKKVKLGLSDDGLATQIALSSDGCVYIRFEQPSAYVSKRVWSSWTVLNLNLSTYKEIDPKSAKPGFDETHKTKYGTIDSKTFEALFKQK